MLDHTTDRRTPTAAGLARLLSRLHHDPSRAADEYERLRRTLMKFFDWRGAWPPDECADLALDRLIRKLDEATDIVNVQSYAHGIARLILLERRRQPTLTPLEETAEPVSPAVFEHDAGAILQDCFERCLGVLPSADRSILLSYYDGSGQSRIARRHALATACGVSRNALRSRVQRQRDGLEKCVHACVGRAS